MLADGIKQLREQNISDSRLYDLAAHPDMQAESITREDAEDLQVFVYAITKYVYDLAERYEEFKERQERRSGPPR